MVLLLIALITIFISTFVSYDDKYLHSWNPETRKAVASINFTEAEAAMQSSSGGTNAPKAGSGGQKTQPQTIQSQISCLCYSKKRNLYFACSKNFRLIVFNEHLNVVTWQLMPCGLITNLVFHDKGDQLIASGKEGCFLIDMEITFSYDPVMAILLDPKGQSIEVRIKQPKKKEYDLNLAKLE